MNALEGGAPLRGRANEPTKVRSVVLAYEDERYASNAHDELWRLIDDRHGLVWQSASRSPFDVSQDFVVRPSDLICEEGMSFSLRWCL
jgi:hypothetical protein